MTFIKNLYAVKLYGNIRQTSNILAIHAKLTVEIICHRCPFITLKNK